MTVQGQLSAGLCGKDHFLGYKDKIGKLLSPLSEELEVPLFAESLS